MRNAERLPVEFDGKQKARRVAERVFPRRRAVQTRFVVDLRLVGRESKFDREVLR